MLQIVSSPNFGLCQLDLCLCSMTAEQGPASQLCVGSAAPEPAGALPYLLPSVTALPLASPASLSYSSSFLQGFTILDTPKLCQVVSSFYF